MNLYNSFVKTAADCAHALLRNEVGKLLSGSRHTSLVIVVATPNNSAGHQFRVGICAEFEFGLQNLVPNELSNPKRMALQVAEFWLMHGCNANSLLDEDPFMFLTSSARPVEQTAHCNKSRKFVVTVEGSDPDTNLVVGRLFFKAMEGFMKKAGKVHLEKGDTSKNETATTYLEKCLKRLSKESTVKIPKKRGHLVELEVG